MAIVGIFFGHIALKSVNFARKLVYQTVGGRLRFGGGFQRGVVLFNATVALVEALLAVGELGECFLERNKIFLSRR